MRALGLLRLGASAGRWRRCGDGGRTGGAPQPADRRCRSGSAPPWQLGAIVGLGATLLAVVRGPDRQAAPALAARCAYCPTRMAASRPRHQCRLPVPSPGAGPISPTGQPAGGVTDQRGQGGQRCSPAPAAVPAGQPDVSRLRRRHCVPHWVQRDDPRAPRTRPFALGRGELRQRLHHRPRRSSRQRPHVHDGGCPPLPSSGRWSTRSRVRRPRRSRRRRAMNSPREPIAELPPRIAALAVRPLQCS